MGTKKVHYVFQKQVTNFSADKDQKHLQCEKIDIPMRDGQTVPLLMVYDSRHYNGNEDENNWIFFTEGYDSAKADVAFEPSRLSLS